MRGVLIYGVMLFFLLSCKQKIQQVDEKTIRVSIQPLGKCDAKLIDSVAKKVAHFYQVEVVINETQKLPQNAFVNIKSPRYRADTIIRSLREIKPDSIDYILAITNSDISTTKRNDDGEIKEPVRKYEDWGIFGLGFRPGPTCVVSTYRMGRKKSVKIERAQKVALHELGHNFGLPHCPNKNCFMQDGAETIKTVDKVDFNLCNSCQKLIGVRN